MTDDPKFEPMRKPFVPPSNRGPRKMRRHHKRRHTRPPLARDDSPYLEDGDRLAAMDTRRPNVRSH